MSAKLGEGAVRDVPVTRRFLGSHVADPRLRTSAREGREDVAIPEVALASTGPGPRRRVRIEVSDWQRPEADLREFDRRVHDAERRGPFSLVLAIDAPVAAFRTAREVRTRYQRLAPRCNGWSRSAAFRKVLARHRALHDLAKPVVRADYDHAIDTWQWVLRLAPEASLAMQLAALFHDVERLGSEADFRIEHHAVDHRDETPHARGADALEVALRGMPLSPEVVAQTAALVARHGRRTPEPAHALLNDADVLSFFSLNSAAFLADYGPVWTSYKVEYCLGRVGATARACLREIRLPRLVARLVGRAEGREVG